MTNCLQCNKELTHVEGRKQKSFCNSFCRNQYFYSKRKVVKFQAEVAEEKEKRQNPLIHAARGRDANGVNNDEVKNLEIEKLEEEMKTLGTGTFANQRRRFLQNKIYDLRTPKNQQ